MLQIRKRIIQLKQLGNGGLITMQFRQKDGLKFTPTNIRFGGLQIGD